MDENQYRAPQETLTEPQQEAWWKRITTLQATVVVVRWTVIFAALLLFG